MRDKEKEKETATTTKTESGQQRQVCGIVMPISAIDGCAEAHWADVLEILEESIEGAGFEANVVSNADDVGIIHKRIIQNLYDNPIVVCDVSGKNPNVMFELGLRLAFDKPTIIVKDDKTAFSFDTSAIEHLEYPRDLRFSKIVDFKEKLAAKIRGTHEKATSDPSYTTFLKHFGEFTVAKLEKKEVSGQEYILEELRNIRFTMRRLERAQMPREARPDRPAGSRRRLDPNEIEMCLRRKSEEEIDQLAQTAAAHPGIRVVRIENCADGHKHLVATVAAEANPRQLEAELFGTPRRPRLPGPEAPQ
jgi:hypothetical protein